MRAQDVEPQRMDTIHVAVDLVNVGVIVTDTKGHFVENLRVDDFRVFDNGTEQLISGFASIEEPARVLLLIEAGPAVYMLEEGHLRAANSLLRGLAAGDRVAVAKYDATPQGILDFTTDKEYVGAAFGELRFNLGFGDLNLSSSMTTVLDWLERIPGKKSIVLLSSGIDTSPGEAWKALVGRLKTSEVRVLAISLTGGLRTAPPATPNSKKKPVAEKPSATAQQFERADAVLKELAASSGGRAYFPKSTADFSAVYAQIAELLRHEYSLGFAPPARDGAVHAIEVRVAAASGWTTAEQRIDHRRAYVAPAPARP
jgi:VWFA-related protein